MPNAAIIHKCQLMTTTTPLNHDPYISNDDLKIVKGYCGEWNSLYSDLEPKKLMSHGKVVGLGLWVEGKARKEAIHERVES